MKIVGYSDRFSVRPGQTYALWSVAKRAQLVRLRHTDANPQGPGCKIEALASISGEYPGQYQIHSGSYAAVPHHPLLNCPNGFTLRAWIYPTTPQKGLQGLLTRPIGLWSLYRRGRVAGPVGRRWDAAGKSEHWRGPAHSTMALYRRQLRRGHGRSLPLSGVAV